MAHRKKSPLMGKASILFTRGLAKTKIKSLIGKSDDKENQREAFKRRLRRIDKTSKFV